MNRYALFCLILLQFFFACSNPNKEQSQKVSLELTSFVKLLEYDLRNLENEITALTDTIKYFYSKKESLVSNADKSLFRFENGIANPLPNADLNLSTLYISELAKDKNEAMDLVYVTNPIDPLFKALFEKYEVISQVYFNSIPQLSRLYPPYEALSVLEPDLDITSFNFFYEADAVNNPERGNVWLSEIYIDPAGRGWVASLIRPVYIDNELLMVVGFDITVNDLIGIYLNNTSRNIVIVDGRGTVVAGKAKAIEGLSLPPLKNHTYSQTITSDSFRAEDFNLFRSKSKEVRNLASRIILSEEKYLSLKDEDESFNVIVERMENIDWYVLDLVFE
ncbi:Cache sensor protein [Arthrospiribacter ruber]|uniref:Cache sensor protein n=1 Tax=Arthrospiribacter ruber TaxID=2487934 RepID=A0A951IWR0_9BACT|nr:Cache sensor protein [Arthrospiribacter ruber]MBW3468630.1 Cache sensor protein [Arthrospiribacter ruber]